MQRTIVGFLSALIMLFLWSESLRADEWPQWRGPTRDDVWSESGVAEKFSHAQIPLLWRVPIGSGYSGPTVAGGRVYVSDRQTEPAEGERVLCFDAKTGQKVWIFAYDCPYRNVGYMAGPRACVSINDGLAYCLGTMGHLHCLDAASGKLVWKKTPDVDYKIRLPIWGIASAPLVVGESAHRSDRRG